MTRGRGNGNPRERTFARAGVHPANPADRVERLGPIPDGAVVRLRSLSLRREIVRIRKSAIAPRE